MKLLIFLLVFQIPILLVQIGSSSIFFNTAHAQEIAGDYEARFQHWLYERNLKRARAKAALNKSKVAELKASNAKPSVLPKNLPSKLEATVTDVVPAAKVSAKRIPTSAVKPRRFVDAQEEFLNNIPKDNKQVQSLLTMIDHAKVYFSINRDGRVKDLLKDDRFREIYSEEMNKDTRKQTYNFFKGYQDYNRNPTEPVATRLNRDTKVTREKMESYLETTGIKSKLTRSLTGKYPAPSQPKVYEDVDTSSSSNAEVAE